MSYSLLGMNVAMLSLSYVYGCKYKNHFMKLSGIGMVNQQKQVEQETAYSAVVVNDHMYPRPNIV